MEHIVTLGCLLLLAGVTLASDSSQQCKDGYCHNDDVTEGEDGDLKAVLYVNKQNTCYFVEKYNPFYEEKPPQLCPVGTRYVWTNPKDWDEDDIQDSGFSLEDLQRFIKSMPKSA